MEAGIRIPRLIVAGVSSGVGKTTVTVALARALQARCLRIALFKCGPDYLDPTYHARAVGSASHNLDGWMMGKDAVLSTFAHAARGADVALIEGVMGLFDGASPTGEEGSTAEIAKWLGAPILLVVDAGGMARSIAPLVQGFASFDRDVRVAGVIANRVGSRGHLELLRSAHKAPPILGALPRDAAGTFPERHLGLRTADATSVSEAVLDRWAEHASQWIALDALLDVARSASPLPAFENMTAPPPPASACRIAVARDPAFHFYYADNLRRLELLGADLVFFSPVADEALPEVDGLYIGGGYPELFASELAANERMLAGVRAFADRSGPVYAECGGLMYLTRAILTAEGQRHPMVSLVPTEVRMCDKLQALGYVEVETQANTFLGSAGTRFRGHQFRYSELSPLPPPSDVEHVYRLRRRRGGETTAEGYRVKNVLASYVHAHWASNPSVPAEFVRACARFRDGASAAQSTPDERGR